MERRLVRIVLIIISAALAVGVLPVIPVGEVLAPDHSGLALSSRSAGDAASTPGSVAPLGVSPVADASTLEKLRHLF